MARRQKIDVIEAAYRLDEADETAWIGELGRAFTEVSGLRTTGAFTYRLTGGRTRLQSVWDDNVRHIIDLRALHDDLPAEQCETLYGRALMASCLRDRLRESGASLDATPAGPIVAKAGGYDIFGLPGIDLDGHGVALSGVTGRDRPSPLEMHRWSCVAAHVACAYRLRRALVRTRAIDAAAAVFTPDGKLEHAPEDDALNARERLRHAVRQIDRARRPSIGEEASFDLWQGLVEGRWSIVDHFAGGSRRYYVVIRNPPEARSIRGLTRAERTALGYVIGGTSNKVGAYALGQSESAYSRTAHRAMRKLGVRTRAALIELAARISGSDASADVDVHALEMSGMKLPIVSLPQIPCPETFTTAEREVAGLVAAGKSNAEIASERATSERTVANQLASMYRKCGVSTREELVVALLKGSAAS